MRTYGRRSSGGGRVADGSHLDEASRGRRLGRRAPPRPGTRKAWLGTAPRAAPAITAVRPWRHTKATASAKGRRQSGPGATPSAGMEWRRRTAAREGEAGERDARCAHRPRACPQGHGGRDDDHDNFCLYLRLWSHGVVEVGGRRLWVRLNEE